MGSKKTARKKELSRFILDLCGFTLDDAGIPATAYTFDLYVAFRYQTIVQAKKWREFSQKNIKIPLQIDAVDKEIKDFAQAIIDQVQKAQAQPWPVKLLKNNYLSRIDWLHKNSEMAIKKLSASPKQLENISTLSVSNIKNDDEDTQLYVDTLNAHRAYLDTLFRLPFALEELVTGIAANKGITYQPQKTTQMLLAVLDTISNTLKYNQGVKVRRGTWFGLIKIAIQATMPKLPMDSDLLDTIANGMLPLVNDIVSATQTLEQAKKALLPSNEPGLAEARKTLLTTMGVELDTLETILQNTLIDPVAECTNYFGSFPKGRVEKIKAVLNGVEKIVQMGEAFNFPTLPSWLKPTHDYYQGLAQKTATVANGLNTAIDVLGILYNKFASFIPEVAKHYFTCASDYEAVLGKTSADIGKNMAYLSFYHLEKASKLNESLKIRFFTDYMMEVKKANAHMEYTYEGYCELEKILDGLKINPLSSLVKQMEQFDVKATQPIQVGLQPQQLALLGMVNRLKDMEKAFAEALVAKNYSEVESLLGQLLKAFLYEKDALNAFKQHFMKAAIQRMLLVSMQKYWLPLLEQVIDNPDTTMQIDTAYLNNLPSIYTKLKNNIRLSTDDYSVLSSCFPKDNHFSKVVILAANLEAQVQDSGEKAVVVAKLTPHQNIITQLKKNVFPPLKAVLNAMQANLDNQLSNCKNLKALSHDNQNLRALCEQKIAYIEAIKRVINSLLSLNEDEKARTLIKLLNGETVLAELHQVSTGSIIRDVVNFAWYVLPADNKDWSENLLNNFLRFYLQGNGLSEILRQRQTFNDMLNAKAIPELMPILSDPLALSNLLPSEEEILDTIISKLFGVNSEQPLASGSHFLRQMAQGLTQECDPKTLKAMFPYEFMATIAHTLLQNENLRSKLRTGLLALADEYDFVVVNGSEEIAKAIKDRLYPLLGIELQSLVEKNALDYAVAFDNKQAVNETQSTAFALYYIRYHALKRLNPAIKTDACIAFLFKTLGYPNEEQFKQKSASLVKAFEQMDDTIWKDSKFLSPDPAVVIEEQLLFLLKNIDFTNAETTDVIRVYLFDTLVIMNLAAANSLDEKHQNAVIESTSKIFTELAQKLQTPAPGYQQLDVQEEEDFVKVRSPSRSKESLLKAMEPAQKKARENYLNHLKKILAASLKNITTEVNARQALLDDDNDDKILGKTVAEIEYQQSKNNPYRRLVLASKGLFEVASLLGTWVPLIMTFFSGGNIALQLFLTTLGIAGVVGASASVFGLTLFAIVILTRFTVKLGGEIWRNRKEFNDIASNPNYSGAKKVFLITLIALKCLGLASLKTLFSDLIVDKITTLLGIKPLSQIFNALKRYPDAEVVQHEKEVLEKLKTKLEEMQRWIVQAMTDVSNDSELDTLSKELNEATATVKAELDRKKLTLTDVRNTAGYEEKIDSHKFIQIEALIKSLTTLREIRDVGKPVIAQQQSDNLLLSTFIELDETRITVNLEGYFAKAKKDATQQVATPASISLFFRMVAAYASNLFSRPTIAQEADPTPGTTSVPWDSQIIDEELAKAYQEEIDRFMGDLVILDKEPETQATVGNNPASFWEAQAKPEAPNSLTASFVNI